MINLRYSVEEGRTESLLAPASSFSSRDYRCLCPSVLPFARELTAVLAMVPEMLL